MLLCSFFVVSQVAGSPVFEQEERRLIKTSDEDTGRWMTETEITEQLVSSHLSFIDVTDHQDIPKGKVMNEKSIPTQIRYESFVRPILSRVELSRIEAFISHFSSYFNRYYTTNTGVQSQQWLLEQVRAALLGYSGPSEVIDWSHTGWAQNSIVVRLEGADPVLKNEVVIVGAHLDSINRNANGNAPGADDNAAGSIVVLETLRILSSVLGFRPKRTMEFHWYAAEEIGLRGSGEIARNYSQTGVNVAAMINQDVPGYWVATREKIAIVTDRVSPAIVSFLKTLVETYCDYEWEEDYCGYGCSDHASWDQYSFPAGYPSEIVWHPDMHTARDTIDTVGFTQVGEHIKLTIGAMVEIAEPY